MDAYRQPIDFINVRVGQSFLIPPSIVYIKVDSPFGNARQVKPGRTIYETFEPGDKVYVIGGGVWDNQSSRANT